MPDDLEDEAREATKMLVGKTVREIWRHRSSEVGIEFTDGTRLFVDAAQNVVELSITNAPD